MQIVWSFRQLHNQNHRPWIPRCGHHFHPFISSLYGVMDKIWNFCNGRLICILLKTLKDEGGIIQILDQRPSEKKNCKKLCRDSKTRFTLQKHRFTAVLVAKKIPIYPLICIFMHMQIVWSFRQWPNQNHRPWKPRCRHHFHPFISCL